MKSLIRLQMQKIQQNVESHPDFFSVSFIIFISLVFHAFNMFDFPYYHDDEGTYMAQAWSLLNFGNLSHYTYWYDHSPVGWMLIALWTKFSGGFFTFGFSINSGRVLMLILQLFSTFFLFKTTKQITRSRYAAIVAALIFAVSPLGVYFHRRVLLDNIMVFWLLASLYLSLCFRRRLLIMVGAAVAFALACLSKESAVYFLPIFLYAVWVNYEKKQRHIAVTTWFVTFVLLCSLYVLYALLKGELFPMGSILDAGGKHVSLIGTLIWQATRSGVKVGEFIQLWTINDVILIGFGLLATIINLLLSFKRKEYLLAVGLTFSYLLYFVKSGSILGFYIIGILPFLAMNLGVIIAESLRLMKNLRQRTILFKGLIIFILVYSFYQGNNIKIPLEETHSLFISKQNSGQINAIAWLRQNISREAVVIIDDYAYIDLKDSKVTDPIYANAHWYWKIARDEDVRAWVLNNDWEKIDYLFTTPQMESDIKEMDRDAILHQAFDNARVYKEFWSAQEGWGANIWKVYSPSEVLADSWQSYKRNFITDEGRVFDPYRDHATTSEGQSYALLRAVWMNDRKTFDRVLSWTNQNLKLTNNNLFAWNWSNENGIWKIKDEGTAPDADEDIALALLFAYREWKTEAYLSQAQGIIADIWQYEVKEINGRSYLTGGNWAARSEEPALNPSYFAPYAYRIFAEVDLEHNWWEVIDTSYEILERSSQERLSGTKAVGLPPDWVVLSKNGELISPQTSYPNFSDHYSFDAFRVPWRVALDWEWNHEPRAQNYLTSLSFLQEAWDRDKKIAAAYTHNGEVFDENEMLEIYCSSLGYFKIHSKDTAGTIYKNKIIAKYYEVGQNYYWDDPKSYYKQNWAWFGTALYADKLPNLWKK